MAPNPVKGVLVEELANSERLLKQYQHALAALPKGSLVAKRIGGGVYYYAAYRREGKVRFDYKGKLSQAQLEEFAKAAAQKAKFRGLISDLKKQIVFIERALHERKRRAR
jgi:hypothetical protein